MSNNFEDFIKNEVNKYMEQIEVPKNIGGIIMEDFEKIKKGEAEANNVEANVEAGSSQTTKKSGKTIKISVAAVSAAVLVGTGVFIGSRFLGNTITTINNHNGAQNSNIATNNTQETELVTDAYTFTGEVKGTQVSFRIPKINIESDDVLKINKEIEEKVTSIAKMIAKDIEEKTAFEAPTAKISYEYYINNDILSVMIVRDDEWGRRHEYRTYNLDKNTGKVISNEDILKIKNIDKAKLENKLKIIAGNKFIEHYGDINSWEGNFYKEQYDKTVSDSNCAVNNIKLYLNSQGRLIVIVREYTLAGADEGIYYVIDYENESATETNNSGAQSSNLATYSYEYEAVNDNYKYIIKSNKDIKEMQEVVLEITEKNNSKTYTSKVCKTNSEGAAGTTYMTFEFELDNGTKGKAIIKYSNVTNNKPSLSIEKISGSENIATDYKELNCIKGNSSANNNNGNNNNTSIFDNASSLSYTNNSKDDINGKIALLKMGEEKFKTEVKDGYYIYTDNFFNNYYIKSIDSISSKFQMMGNDDWAALFKCTVDYTDKDGHKKKIDVAVVVPTDNHPAWFSAPFDNFCGSTSFVRSFTDLYSEPVEEVSDSEIADIQKAISDPKQRAFVLFNYTSPDDFIENYDSLARKSDGAPIKYSLAKTEYITRPTESQKQILKKTDPYMLETGSTYLIDEQSIIKYLEERFNITFTSEEVRKAFGVYYNEELNLYVLWMSDSAFLSMKVKSAKRIGDRYELELNYGAKVVIEKGNKDGTYYFKSCQGFDRYSEDN